MRRPRMLCGGGGEVAEKFFGGQLTKIRREGSGRVGKGRPWAVPFVQPITPSFAHTIWRKCEVRVRVRVRVQHPL
jgi:hypothetical protein